jgi:hypothetical protein
VPEMVSRRAILHRSRNRFLLSSSSAFRSFQDWQFKKNIFANILARSVCFHWQQGIVFS